MSDLNDDLLNYELGEELLDDPTLIAGDEDDLLLSDEELEKDVSSAQKAALKTEAEKWVTSKLKTKSSSSTSLNTNDNIKKTDDVVTTSSSTCNEASPEREIPNTENNNSSSLQIDSNVTTSEEIPDSKNSQLKDENSKRRLSLSSTSENDQQTKNDEVTSTNKEIEDQSVSQTTTTTTTITPTIIAKPTQNVIKEELIQSSQESSSAAEGEELYSDPREDLEERGERTNIKHTNERGAHDSSEKIHYTKFGPSKRGRSGVLIRGGPYAGPRGPIRYPNVHYPQYSSHGNEHYNTQNQYSYQSVDTSMQSYPMMNPPRMEPRPPLPGPNFRPQNPNEFMYRGPRNEFVNHVNGATTYYGPPGQVRPMFRPDGNMALGPQPPHIRHRMPLPPRAPGIPPQTQPQPPYLGPTVVTSQHQPPPNTSHPNNFTILANVQSTGQGVTQPVIPRKVLINPNFKGGVEAATNQLMKDTQFMQAISSHAVHLQSDEELLRQQEEFIKRNRMHIEKRRYDRSPDRSRSRERSYSPVRRDRRGSSRERRGGSPRGRPRRASSRENEDRFPKRRRSGSFERKKEGDKFEEEEDEETRAYRQEIEKQKAMREKILRDKEMRRRKAAEEKQVVEEKVATDDGPQKLKPIIVTQSKIISLKKKANTESTAAQMTTTTTPATTTTTTTKPKTAIVQQQQQAIQRKIPTAKILPEAKYNKNEQQHAVKDASTATLNPTATMAVIKPVIKKTISVQADINTQINKNKNDDDDDDDGDDNDENELLDEELLLADTPSPPSSPSPIPVKSKRSIQLTKDTKGITTTTNTSTAGNGKFTSSNRRVVLKPSTTTPIIKQHDDKKDSLDIHNRKPIFDRLEKKIAVNESIKKKIQRIVIKNTE